MRVQASSDRFRQAITVSAILALLWAQQTAFCFDCRRPVDLIEIARNGGSVPCRSAGSEQDAGPPCTEGPAPQCPHSKPPADTGDTDKQSSDGEGCRCQRQLGVDDGVLSPAVRVPSLDPAGCCPGEESATRSGLRIAGPDGTTRCRGKPPPAREANLEVAAGSSTLPLLFGHWLD